MLSTPVKGIIINEGAQIYCERRGNGPLLLLITGALDDAGFYSSAAEILADQFIVVCLL
jgi:hypothetical protein